MRASNSSKIKEKVRRLPDRPGVYLMKDRFGRIIYVGKAKSLKKRVATYFQASRQSTHHPKVRALVEVIADFDIVEVKNETEALLLEGKLIKEWKPRYNTLFTDDKRFLILRVDIQSPIPRFRLTRLRKEDGSRYFGPFAYSGPLRRTLAEIRKKFGVILGDVTPQKLPDGRYRLYNDVRSDLFEFPNVVTPEEYRERVDKACEFLEGKTRDWIEELRKEMLKAAENQRFEKAAELRDIVFSLEQTLIKTRKFVRDPLLADSSEPALESLKKNLELPALPERIECFDISHISGTFVVASLVVFTDGRPDKNNYRRFRIKSFIGNDDYRAMEEVVGRRYRRLADEGRPFPDLVVIDGGKGQVGSALRAFFSLNLDPPPLVGLAETKEMIVFPDEREPLELPVRDPGLRLLQRVRNEAHRFANAYNIELRKRLLRESILDDFPGIGKVRRAALLEHFRSIDHLRRASAEEIAEVPGIGLKTAEKLHEYLAARR
ncbi:MAG TPA: excinuclease ABC subunit UvrC [Opitutales bacterium]|nr:excinuclease ABC subunit UvrC [Opitutales bacterium]